GGGAGGGGGDGDGGGGGGGGNDVPCTFKVTTDYSWPCGNDSRYGWLAAYCYTRSEEEYDCNQDVPIKTVPGTAPGTGGPGSPTNPGGGGGGGAGSVMSVEEFIAALCMFLECNPFGIPGEGCIAYAAKAHQGMEYDPDIERFNCAMTFFGNLGTAGGAMAGAPGCIKAAKKYFDTKNAQHSRKLLKEAMAKAPAEDEDEMPELVASYFYKLGPLYDYMQAYVDLYKERFDAPKFVDKTFEYGVVAIMDSINHKLDDLHKAGLLYELDTLDIPEMVVIPATTGGQVSSGVRRKAPKTAKDVAASLIFFMPNWRYICEDFNLRHYVERMKNTYRIADGLEPLDDNYFSSERLQVYIDKQDSCLQAMVDMGFVDWKELVESANKDRLEYYEGASKNTCATIKLEIEQKLVLTRQAFRGTLTVDNGTKTTLTDIDLKVVVESMLGEQATSHEFQINYESITGFEGSTKGPWSLGPNAKGVATILFIPTKYAAPDTLTTYAFGGSLSFKDGDGVEQYRELIPVKLQVKPSPELDLTYFMQRDIYGDNPLTEEVEPVIPSEFSVLIHNKGKGEATNVRMMTKQPKIVENAKGLLVDFAIVSSSLNGGEKAMALDDEIATQFGNIAAGSSSYATWDLTCSLLGHFTSYDVSVTHVTSYGNPDLSLLDEVTIHELIHSVNARLGEQKYRAWVTNDVEDGHAEPDHIYFSNGEDEDLKTLSAITSVTALGDSKWRVRVTVPQKEWFYTAVADPTGGSAKILSIKDETTGEDIDPENFWTTQWTMQDGWDPLPENKLHIVDYADGPKTFSYVVEFEPTPDVRLDVLSIATVPADDDIAEAVIDQLTVTFNKGIDATTFTRDDLVLRYEGVKQNIDLPITMVENDSIFRLNTSSLSANGYYWLQVKTDSIRDKEGFLGYKGKQVKWMLFKDGLVHYNVMPWPAEGGTIESSSGNAEGNALYGHLLTLTGAPTEGYDFSYWGLLADEVTTNSAHGNAAGIKGKFLAPKIGTDFDESKLERFSTDPTITVEMNKMYNLVAVFKPKPYNVNIVVPTAVGEVNVGSGIYDYGTVLNLKATANDGYRIIGFIVNDDTDHEVGGDEYEHTVTGDATIVVDYKDYAPVSVILQDTKDYVPEAVELANVKLQRSFRKGSWNSICLPCAVDNPEEVFGTGTKVARLDGLFNGQFLVFEVVSRMEANVPYLIKPGTITNNSLLANGQTKTSFYDIMGTSIEEPGADGPIDKTSDGIDFVGSYQNVMVPTADGNYYISSDVVYYVDEAAMVPTGRFRGYFHTEIEGLAKRMGVQIGDEIETAIIDLPGQTPMGNIYSIDGKLVYKAGDTKNLRKLPTGIYIMNGCKVVVK
ncbi:MAG: Ig-like domain-containing protein, partial [Bacteroidaceae bacterium]|nr:Ig-like domain-containing protein [Bacteroidaceae bacterium]